MSEKVRVRFAPSPTGYLHVGGARTALYNYLFAKKHGGEFVLRIEDTDLERSTQESMQMVIADLDWLGLHWAEGPNPKTLMDRGEFGPYRQSERKKIYQKHVDQFLAEGKAYRCYHSDEELEREREENLKEGRPLHHTCEYRNQAEVLDKTHTIRFKIPFESEKKALYPDLAGQGSLVLNDLVRGEVTLPFDMVGDFVIIRSNGMPVYNFCCAIDDYEMGITHVFRGEDHLNNTLRQFWVYQAIGAKKMPEFAHMSMILGPDKQKLSKRHGATSCNEYKKGGFLPEAVNNYLALLGWSPGDDKELMSMQEMVDLFSSNRFIKSPSVFDEKKLRWMNSQHLRGLSNSELWQQVQPFVDEAGLSLPESTEWQNQMMETFKPKMEVLTDAVELLAPFDASRFAVAEEAKEALSWESSKAVIEKWMELVSAQSEISEDGFLEIQNQVKAECGVKGKHLFMPLRVAVIGKPHGADIGKIVPWLKRDDLLTRAKASLEHC